MWRVSRYRVSPGLPKLVQGLVHLMSPLVVLVPEAILMATLRDGFAHLDAQPSFVSHDSCAGAVHVAVPTVSLHRHFHLRNALPGQSDTFHWGIAQLFCHGLRILRACYSILMLRSTPQPDRTQSRTPCHPWHDTRSAPRPTEYYCRGNKERCPAQRTFRSLTGELPSRSVQFIHLHLGVPR